MPKKSLKSKRGTSKKGGKGYKRTRKMKGGVSYNPVFSTTLLPKGTYYELNNYNDDPSRPPEVIDSRLLPTLKGGKKKNTRKRQQPNSFYVLTTDFEKKGGKKSRKSRRKRKMKGGSLVGTDLITGLNTTNTNSVIAFGTTGGTEYMYNTLAGKSIDSGPYMSPETPVEPVLA